MGEGSEPVPGRRTTRLVSNTLIRGSAQVASVIASFVLLPFLVRAFTLADYGVFMLASAVTGYAALLDLGVGATLVRMVAERLARGESDEVGPVIASGASFYAVAGVIAALIMVGIGVLGGALFAVSPAQAKLLAQLLAIGAFVQLFYWPASAATHALAGFERYDLLSAASVVQTVCSVIAVVVVLVTKTGPVALAAINAGITLAASLAYCLLLARVTRGKIGRIRPRVSLVRTVMRDGLPLFSLQISALLGRQATDRIVLGVFLGPVAVGVYEIAAKLSALVSQAADLLTGVILPVASNMNAQEHKESLRALFVRGARYSVAAIAPVVVILACIARPFIQAWFGPGMAAAAPVASVLLLSQLFVPLYLMGDPILIGMNRIGRWAGWGFFVAALNVVLSVVLVKAVGILGVALGTAIATLVELPLYAKVVVREVGIDWRQWLRESSLPAYPLLVVPTVIALAASRTALGQNIVTLLVVCIVAAVPYWALCWMLVLPRWERVELLSVVGSMVRRPDRASSDS